LESENGKTLIIQTADGKTQEEIGMTNLPALDDHNGWADWWRKYIGVNVVPAIYKDKIPTEKWATDVRGNWQNEPIPESLHNEWKAQNKFSQGMAIVMGHVFHREDRLGQFLACLDTDNELATKRLAMKSDKTLVQQRKSDLDRAHSFFYSLRPVKRKPASSVAGEYGKELEYRFKNNLAPKFELRCVGDVVYAGQHESGYHYEIMGLTEPALANTDEIEKEVEKICNEYGLKNTIEQPATELFKEDFIIYEGNNRSRELKRAMCSLLSRNLPINVSLDAIKSLASDWHNKHCKPPYTEQEGIFERNWKQSIEFVNRGAEPIGEATEPEEKQWTDSEVEKWRIRLLEKRKALYDIVRDNLPALHKPLEFTLTVKSILNIRGVTLPFAGILLGRASSLKTVAIEMLRDYPKWTYYSNEFSAKSFVSHSAKAKSKDLEKIDLLPRIKNKLFLTPELGPTFSKRDEDVLEEIGILASVLDGNGYKSDSGVHGERGYYGEYFFVMIGASVDVPPRVYRHLSQIGPKLYFYRLEKQSKTEDDYLINIKKSDFDKKKEPIKKALLEYLEEFDMNPMVVEINNIPKVPPNYEKDDEKAIRYIIKLSMLLGPLRTIVPTWETLGTHGSDYGYRLALVEEPDRAQTQLINLARGHALSVGRNYITVEDIPIIIETVLSTAPLERVVIFDILLAHNGTLTTSEICESMNVSKNTALRTMTELKAVGLVTMEPNEWDEEQYNQPRTITLKPEFKWFMGDTFKKIRSICLEKLPVCVSHIHASTLDRSLLDNTHTQGGKL